MKKKAVYLIVIAILLLDFAALDDITTGNEPNYIGEAWVLAISIVTLSAMVIILTRKS